MYPAYYYDNAFHLSKVTMMTIFLCPGLHIFMDLPEYGLDYVNYGHDYCTLVPSNTEEGESDAAVQDTGDDFSNK